jgi:hypothetical protein
MADFRWVKNWNGRAIGPAPDFPTFFIFPEPSSVQDFRLKVRSNAENMPYGTEPVMSMGFSPECILGFKTKRIQHI